MFSNVVVKMNVLMARKLTNVPFLIKGCRDGNRSSQLRLYEHFYSYGMGICLRYCSSREEAIEVLNDGFLKAFTKIDQYQPAYPFKAWLRKILINSSIDYHRKYHKLPAAEEISFDAEARSATHNLALEHLAYDDLLKVMQQLSPVYRIVFNLYIVDGLTHKEIGAKLGISVGTSKSNLSKARRKIQALLTESHDIYYKPR